MTSLVQIISALGFAGSMLLATVPASAQQVCLSHDAAVTRLEKEFDEKVVGRGIANGGKAMFELFVSEAGSWSVVVSQPNGHSCVVASGESWRQLPLLIGDPA